MSDHARTANIDIPCDGMCVTASDVGLPGTADDIAYAHPGCPRHDPDAVCGCGTPDRCMSPTHGQVSYDEALRIRHSQNSNDPRASGRYCVSADDCEADHHLYACPNYTNERDDDA